MREKDELVISICETLVEERLIEAYAYDHFKKSKAVLPPFAVYRRIARDNFPADSIVYWRGGGIDLEIYASDPDEMDGIMERVEELFAQNETFYECTADTVYLESEDFYESLYEL